VAGEKIFADGTLIKANASIKSLVARSDAPSPSLSPNEYVEKVFQENPAKSEHNSERKDDNNTPAQTNNTDKAVRKTPRKRRRFNMEHMSRTDPDAAYIARKGKRMFSYKHPFTSDRKQRVITAAVMTPGAITEDQVLKELLDR
jgi:hypothetical protein